ncbi:hypothetical protein LJB89_01520, partial [Tyzzerella sp. OttesenSCG-928-J15]|nr:hypothetical protein [Tyzzerella sp. OttesenSCG-928-J15]
TISIDELILRGYKIFYKPKSTFMPCKAYVNDNCKFFADGFTALCDAWEYSHKGPHIDDVIDDLELLNNHFSKIKNWNPLEDLDCKKCNNVIMCGGKYFCRENCSYENRYFLDLFLKKYVEYEMKDKSVFFPNMT